jgi:hypothetical protein
MKYSTQTKIMAIQVKISQLFANVISKIYNYYLKFVVEGHIWQYFSQNAMV